MNGLDVVKEEMAKRGCHRMMIESKAVPIVLDIVAGTGYDYTNLYEARDEIEKAQEEANKAIKDAKKEAEEAKKAADEYISKLEAKAEYLQESVDYINSFNKRLMECETPQGRDNMRKLQLFLNLTNYMMTPGTAPAFIVALAAIMSEKEFNVTESMKRINCNIVI